MKRTWRGAVRFLPLAVFGGVAALAGCRPATVPAAAAPTPQAPAVPQSAVPQSDEVRALLARQPMARVHSAGQPAPDAWPELAAAGIGTVIDLRPDAERPGRDEAAEVAAAGLAYRQIPVAGAQDLTPEAARALWQAIDAAPGEVLVHCASGNRVGALLAIAAAGEGGMAPEQALALGREAGMTSLEPRVREVLGLPAAPGNP